MSRTLVARTIVNKVIHELIKLKAFHHKLYTPQENLEIENKLTEVVTKVLEDEDM